MLARLARKHRAEAAGDVSDPVLLEVFNNRFMHIAEQMGAVLENTAHSVNIKERLDFSCALFDSNGELVANAPHMPVHLGSMDASVKAVLNARKSGPRPGEAYLVNAPYNGGTHLPDLTVISPVFLQDAQAADFFVASRAHHADIGGITPGSMPPDSRHIDEEGVLFDNFLLVSGGRLEESRLNEALTGGPWPARNPSRNLADIKAQLAANTKGAGELAALVGHYGAATVRAYMTHVRDNAEESVRRVIDRLEDGRFACTMDGDERIVVDIRIDRRRREAVIDFSESSGQSGGNFNAPLADLPGLRALRFPLAGGRGYSDEFRLHEAATHYPSRRHAAEPPLAGRGGCRQRGDLAVRGGHAVRRPGGYGRGAGDHEQRHFRQ